MEIGPKENEECTWTNYEIVDLGHPQWTHTITALGISLFKLKLDLVLTHLKVE